MSICVTHPEVAAQWHPTKNGNLKPEDYTSGSGIIPWWLCQKKCDSGCSHEWKAAIYSRTSGVGCPYCSKPKKKFCIHESIKYTNPEILHEWHPTLNGSLKPENFTMGSDTKIWWFCPKKCSQGCPHIYKSSINSRCGSKSGCIYCCHNPVNLCFHTSIAYTHPQFVEEFHPTKNGNLKPENIVSGSGLLVWWLCKKNNKCDCPHEWKAAIGDRCDRNRGCPYCSIPSKKICIHNSLSVLYPNIAKQWHPTKNGNRNSQEVGPGSNTKAWWLCDKTCSYGCVHEWEAVIEPRCTRNIGCPFCGINGKGHCFHDSMQFKYPKLMEEWHPTKNINIKPEKISHGSSIKIWWLCKRANHEYHSIVAGRCLAGLGCPHCVNKTESMLQEFLIKFYPNLIRGFKLDSCKNINHLPFDFCLEEQCVIIELDGGQHFKQVRDWVSPEKQIKRDIYKMRKAEEAGYKVIRIFQEDVYKYNEDWLEKYLLPEIQSENRNHAFIAVKPGLYDEHMRIYVEDEIGSISDSESEKSDEDLVIQL
jgi:very-short-patch-repair endonuclease